jgi:basic membrane protein A and related proteins
MKSGVLHILLLVVLVLSIIGSGCTQPSATTVPVVYIVYGSEKGDLSYTDSAAQGLMAAHQGRSIITKEFVPRDFAALPGLLNSTDGSEKPGLIITVGFQYANFTRQLAQAHPEIQFLAIDQAGIGSDNTRAYEITSYGDSFQAGVLAASATKTGKVGIILGTQSEILNTFLQGYMDGAHAVNASITVDQAYVRYNSTNGFTDPDEAGRLAGRMYRNGTDVIYTCAGYSNTGAFDAARNTTGRYVIGTDSDQSPLGPDFVLASAMKRVDRVVYTGITDHLNGSFTGGNQVAGLKDGVTGMAYNPKFAFYNETVSAWEGKAQEEETKYLLSRALPEQK